MSPLAVAMIGVLGGSAVEGRAACLQPAQRVCSEYFKSDAVFTGKVESRHADEDETRYTVHVRERYLGQLDESVEVFTANDSGRLKLEPGREYLLFARRAGGRLEVADDCAGNSGPVDQVADRIAAIHTLEHGATTIEGYVSTEPSWEPVAGAKLEVRGEQRTFAVETDSHGAFRVEVSPGNYSVVALTPGITPFDLSVDDPRAVSVARGQCGQVQLVAPTQRRDQ